MRFALPLVFGMVAGSTLPLQAQRTELLGRVDAVVGDSVITNIDVQEALLAWQAQTGQEPPTDSIALLRLRHELVRDQIDQLLLLQAAARDTTLRVSEPAINQAVDGRIAQLQQRMGGPAALERALAESNLTLQTYRERLRLQQRRETLIQNYLRKVRQQRKPPPVTEEEIREFFQANQDRIGTRPPTITFRQVVIPIEPSEAAMTAARAKADSVLQLARGGEDFAQLARRFSEDPGSRELGGDLGFNRPGVWYAPFDRAVFSVGLRPGDIIGPIRTPVGLHVLRVERIRGAERQVRHVLIRPAITADDRARTRAIADSLGNVIRAGAAVDSIAARWGDPDELIRVGPWRRDSLPEPYGRLFADAQEGQVVGPFELDGDGPAPKIGVARVTDLEPARPATVDDYRTTILEQLAQAKLMEELLQELRQRTYIEVRLPPDPGGRASG